MNSRKAQIEKHPLFSFVDDTKQGKYTETIPYEVPQEYLRLVIPEYDRVLIHDDGDPIGVHLFGVR
jgi:hypothetical protein